MFTILPLSFIFKLLSEYRDLSSTNRKINIKTVHEVTFMEVVRFKILLVQLSLTWKLDLVFFMGKAASCIDYW